MKIFYTHFYQPDGTKGKLIKCYRFYNGATYTADHIDRLNSRRVLRRAVLAPRVEQRLYLNLHAPHYDYTSS